MQNKALIFLAGLFLAVSCLNMGDPYADGELNTLTVQAVYPEGMAARGGAGVSIENIAGGVTYTLVTDASARAETRLPNGLSAQPCSSWALPRSKASASRR